ncbi:MAG: hypothetical protein V3V76_09595, partial [Candidatus Adiutricales bacterium]
TSAFRALLLTSLSAGRFDAAYLHYFLIHHFEIAERSVFANRMVKPGFSRFFYLREIDTSGFYGYHESAFRLV